MSEKFIPMFPPFLDQGSSGDAPDFLSKKLIERHLMKKSEFLSGDYPAKGVRTLQASLGFTGDDIDGNFGPRTRKADREQNDFDWSSVPATPGKITLWYGSAHKGDKIWPTSKEE